MAVDERVEVQLGARVEDFIRAFQRATSELKSFEAEVSKGRDDLKKFEDTARRTGAGVKQSAETAGQSLRNLGTAAAVGFAALSAAVAGATKTFADFDKTMNGIQAVTGATAAELDKIRAAALQVGVDTKFSTQQAANAFFELGKAGLTTTQSLEAMPGVVALAASAGIDLGNAAEVAAGTVRGFGLAMSDTTRVADVLAQSANQSAVDVSDLAQSFKFIAPVASASGQTLEGMSAALAILGNNMIKGEQAGTAMRASLLRLQAPSEEAAKTMGVIGLKVADANGKMKPFGQLLQELSDKTAKFNAVGQQEIFKNLFGLESVSAISALVNTIRQTPGAFAQMEAAMEKAGGSAKRMQDTMQRGISASIDLMKGSAATAAQVLGEQMAPAVQVVVDKITDLLNGFIKADQPTKTLTYAIFGLAGAFLALTIAANGVVATSKLVADGFKVMAAGAAWLNNAIRALIISIGYELIIAFQAAKAAGASTMAAGATAVAPYVAAIAVAVAAVYTLAAAWDYVKAKAAEAEAVVAQGEERNRTAQLQIVQSRQRTNAQIREQLKDKGLSADERKGLEDRLARGEAFVGSVTKEVRGSAPKIQVPAAASTSTTTGGASFSLPDGKAGKADAAAAQQAKQAADERARFIAALQDAELARIDRNKDAKLQALQTEFDQGKKSVAEYYDARAKVEKQADNDTLAILNKQAAATKAGTADQVQAMGRVDDFKAKSEARARGLIDERRKAEEQAAKALQVNEQSARLAIIDRAVAEIEAAEMIGGTKEDTAKKIASIEEKLRLDLAALDDAALEKEKQRQKQASDIAKKNADDYTKLVEDGTKKQAKAMQDVGSVANAISGALGNLRDAFDEATDPEIAEAFKTIDLAMGTAASGVGILADGVSGNLVGALTKGIDLAGRLLGEFVRIQNQARDFALTMADVSIRFDDETRKIGRNNSFADLVDTVADETGVNKVGNADQFRARLAARANEFGVDPQLLERAVQAKRRIEAVEAEQKKLVDDEQNPFFVGGVQDGQFLGRDEYFATRRRVLDGALAQARQDFDTVVNSVPDELKKGTSVEDAKKQVKEIVQQQAEALLEFELGARDDAGNRISIERRAQLDIDRLDADFADAKKKRDKQRADLKKRYAEQEAADLERLGKILTDLSKLDAETEKKVKGIRDEGIAVRQKSVEQNKRERIQDVQDEATAKRTELNAEISKIQKAAKEREAAHKDALEQIDAEESKATTAHENAVSRIKTDLQERKAAHIEKMRILDAELATQTAITGQTRQQLDNLLAVERLKANAAAGISSNGSSSTSSLSTYGLGSTSTAAGAAGSYTANAEAELRRLGLIKHTGGEVLASDAGWMPGLRSDERMQILQVGERVIPADVTRDMSAGRLRGAQHTTIAPVIQIGNFSGSQENIRQLAREVMRQAGGLLRGRGNYANA